MSVGYRVRVSQRHRPCIFHLHIMWTGIFIMYLRARFHFLGHSSSLSPQNRKLDTFSRPDHVTCMPHHLRALRRVAVATATSGVHSSLALSQDAGLAVSDSRYSSLEGEREAAEGWPV
jgi:hypothetical protein